VVRSKNSQRIFVKSVALAVLPPATLLKQSWPSGFIEGFTLIVKLL
jgi:hypothetical protein